MVLAKGIYQNEFPAEVIWDKSFTQPISCKNGVWIFRLFLNRYVSDRFVRSMNVISWKWRWEKCVEKWHCFPTCRPLSVGFIQDTMANTSVHRPVPIYTEEKALHLIKVFIAVVSIMLLLGWQQIIVLNPLKTGKADMVWQMLFPEDPSKLLRVYI